MAVFSGNGSNTAPSFTFSSNTNTGFFRNGSNNIGVAANATHVAGFQESGAHFYVTGTGTAASPNFGISSNGRPDVAISGATNAILISNGDLARFGSSATDTAISLASIAASGTTNGSAGIRFFPAQNGSVWSEIRGGRDGNFGSASARATNLIFLTSENETAPTEKMRLTSGSGYLRMASGTGGIQFNGNIAGANALDDYEESVYTMELFDASTGGNQSATTAIAQYTKIGRVVTVSAQLLNISTAGMTAGGILYFSLPYASANLTGGLGIGGVIPDTVTFSGYLNPVVPDNVSRGRIEDAISGGSSSFVTVSDISTGVSNLKINFTYIAA